MVRLGLIVCAYYGDSACDFCGGLCLCAFVVYCWWVWLVCGWLVSVRDVDVACYLCGWFIMIAVNNVDILVSWLYMLWWFCYLL